MIKKGKQLLLH